MTGRHDCSGPSRREVRIDVWKYLQTIVMGLYAVSEQKLAHPHRVLSRYGFDIPDLYPHLFFHDTDGEDDSKANDD